MLLGLLVGAGFGIWDLIVTAMDPLSEDDPGALLLFYGPMFTLWGLTGFVAYLRTRRFLDAIKSSAFIAFVTFVVFDLAVILRVNLFVDALTHRTDWQNVAMRFHNSGVESLRVYVNYEYVTGAPFKILVATMIGCVTGLIGESIGRLGRGRMPRARST